MALIKVNLLRGTEEQMRNFLQQFAKRFVRKEKSSIAFKVLFADFKKSLELNNQILDIIGDANDKLSGDYIFDEHYIHTTCEQLTGLLRELIVTINHLTSQKYPGLFNSFHRIEEDLTLILQGKVLSQDIPLTLPYSEITRDHIDAVGGKNCHIAEIGSYLGLRIPRGFAITTSAFELYWKAGGLGEPVARIKEQWLGEKLSLSEASLKIQELIFKTPVPDILEKAILAAVTEVVGKDGPCEPCFAVRSSALGEDGVTSFAGQYQSCLSISPDQISGAYKQVVASLYSQQAMEYRLKKDFRPEEIMMAVACQLMIPAKVSGVMYTYDPLRPEDETILISSAWGLGEPVVSGAVPTDHFVLERKPPHKVIEMQIVCKDESMVITEHGGPTSAPVREEQRMEPSLKARQLHDMAEIGILLERYFRAPQDVEFAIDQAGQIVLLQSRQLQLYYDRPPRASDLSGLDGRYPVLLRGKGVAAMEGVASGPIWILEAGKDLADFPMGAVLVARYASPQLAKVIHKAAGFITDIGSTTGHLATVAREFRVPALFNTGDATTILNDGCEITMDIECLTIYEGQVSELGHYSLQEEVIEDMFEYRQLRRILRKIEPLNLVDPESDNFSPEHCKTYHDLTRFIHEKAVEAIIDIGFYHAHHRDTQAGKLLWEYPLDLVIIDVGGGVEGEHTKGVLAEEINSVPMQELLRGMSWPGVWDMTPSRVDVNSFMSSLTRTVPIQNSSPQDVGRNLAVISSEYTNINFRLGYHFTVIDAYISENILDNHLYFRFSGGVTDTVRRSRRIKLLGVILSYYDFLCETHGDTMVARLKRMDRKSMLKRLFLLGLLVAFTRQLDVKMINDARIDQYFKEIQTIMEESNDD